MNILCVIDMQQMREFLLLYSGWFRVFLPRFYLWWQSNQAGRKIPKQSLQIRS